MDGSVKSSLLNIVQYPMFLHERIMNADFPKRENDFMLQLRNGAGNLMFDRVKMVHCSVDKVQNVEAHHVPT